MRASVLAATRKREFPALEVNRGQVGFPVGMRYLERRRKAVRLIVHLWRRALTQTTPLGLKAYRRTSNPQGRRNFGAFIAD